MTQAEAQAYNAGVRDTLALARFLADDLVRPSPIAAEGLDALADEGQALLVPVAADRQVSERVEAA